MIVHTLIKTHIVNFTINTLFDNFSYNFKMLPESIWFTYYEDMNTDGFDLTSAFNVKIINSDKSICITYICTENMVYVSRPQVAKHVVNNNNVYVLDSDLREITLIKDKMYTTTDFFYAAIDVHNIPVPNINNFVVI